MWWSLESSLNSIKLGTNKLNVNKTCHQEGLQTEIN